MTAVKEYTLPPVDMREVLRYMGVRGEADTASLSELEASLTPLLTPRVCYLCLPVSTDGDRVLIGDRECHSHSLARLLTGSASAVIFAATVGTAPDRLIRKHERLSPSHALAVSAIGNERIEALCDSFCSELPSLFADCGGITRRFSAGYGDLPLEFQRDIFELLRPERHIGVTLGAGLLMTPTKSVTAIVGILPKEK